MKEKLIINKKSLKAEDGYKALSIRIKDETVKRLDEFSQENQSFQKRTDKRFDRLCN